MDRGARGLGQKGAYTNMSVGGHARMAEPEHANGDGDIGGGDGDGNDDGS